MQYYAATGTLEVKCCIAKAPKRLLLVLARLRGETTPREGGRTDRLYTSCSYSSTQPIDGKDEKITSRFITCGTLLLVYTLFTRNRVRRMASILWCDVMETGITLSRAKPDHLLYGKTCSPSPDPDNAQPCLPESNGAKFDALEEEVDLHQQFRSVRPIRHYCPSTSIDMICPSETCGLGTGQWPLDATVAY